MNQIHLLKVYEIIKNCDRIDPMDIELQTNYFWKQNKHLTMSI